MANLGRPLRTIEVLSVDSSREPAEKPEQVVDVARDASRAEEQTLAEA